MLKRQPLGNDTFPFEVVTDELARVHLQCTVCGGYERMFDGLAMGQLMAARLGKLRFRLLTPWWVYGAVRFLFRHLHCLEW